MDVSDEPEEEAEDVEESEGREPERGDAEPDAPTSVEENEAMSTVLSGDTLDGVQRDAGDL